MSHMRFEVRIPARPVVRPPARSLAEAHARLIAGEAEVRLVNEGSGRVATLARDGHGGERLTVDRARAAGTG
ncbi:MAG: hypothetical protein MUE51_01100 [Thermoleophilia bacterium]|jgi:hypothetical protein|nr:hypothetical protein [Thermoleophilia bacterium]